VENFPPPPIKASIAQIITMIKFFLIYLALSNANPLVWLGHASADDPLPEWLSNLKNNKIYSFMMIFFMGNAIEGMLLQTGAFEIYANNDLIFSKIQSGNIPQPQAVTTKIDELLGKTVASDSWL